MANSQELQKIENVPYIQENLGLASLVNFYHKTYFHVNLTSINKNIQNYVTNVYFIGLKTNNNTLYNYLEDSLVSLQEKIKLLKQQRNKRSLFDGLGTTIRYVTGNLDQTDLKEIMSNMQILRNNEDTINLQNTKTLSVLTFLQNKFENTTNNINSQLLQTLKILNKLDEEIKIQEIILKEIFNIKSFETYIDKLLNIITFSVKEEINLLLINVSDIIEIERLLNTIFSYNELIPFSKLFYFEFMNLCKLNTIVSDQEIIFVLKIPIIYRTIYNYQKIYPTLFNQTNLLIVPTTYVLEDKYIYFLEKPCIELSIKQALCYNIINNECNIKTLTNCPVVNSDNYSQISVMNNNQLLVNTNQKLSLFEHCNKTHITVNRPTIISKFCEMSALNNNYVFKGFLNTSIKIPNEGNFYNFQVQRINFQPLDTYNDVKSKMKDLQNNIGLTNLKWENRSTSFSLYAILIILCSMCFAYKYGSKIRNCRKRDRKIEITEESAIPLQAVQISPCLSQEIQA